MTFSGMTKNELSRMPIEDRCCAVSELAAIVRMSGTIQISGNKDITINFTTENAAIARRIFSLIKGVYTTDVEVRVKRNKQLKKNNNYLIIVKDREVSKQILDDVGFSYNESSIFIPNFRIPEEIINNRCCKRSYIRGAFLGGGSITNPEKTYHLEFVTSSETHGKDLSDLINSFSLNSKIVMRKESYVIYLKEADQIVDLLNIIGAYQALLKLEDIRVLKDVRNNINRLVNCETANLGKTINASMRQIENIKLIDERVGLNKLPNSLREIAEVRLKNPDATLKELGEYLNPPVGKSGVNHRLRKIEKLANDIEGRK